ncbi:MAG: CorA family divalent cation transporter [Tissierellia bacterium]|nr:CorA family divalent cation transporter [Tissierellia bacterium]
MIYEITQKNQYMEISGEQLAQGLENDRPHVAYLTLDELKEQRDALGISDYVISALEGRLRSLQNYLSVMEDYTFGVINIIDANDVFSNRDKIGLYMAKDLFLAVDIVDVDQSTIGAFRHAVEWNREESFSIGQFINNFIKALITHHSALFDELRTGIEKLDDGVLDEDPDAEMMVQISKYSHVLLELYGYYEQLDDLCDILIENANGILEESDTKHFRFLSARLSRYSMNAQLLREYAIQVRESYQAQIDINLNQVMKVFTVVATIFLPLTLLVGWYGMNFKYMPELDWEHGYRWVITLSVLIVVASIYFFKKKKLL